MMLWQMDRVGMLLLQLSLCLHACVCVCFFVVRIHGEWGEWWSDVWAITEGFTYAGHREPQHWMHRLEGCNIRSQTLPFFLSDFIANIFSAYVNLLTYLSIDLFIFCWFIYLFFC